ncbi:MAG TPA: hypothetical protein VGN98_18650 [Tianweitania sediminis]|jgi:hypothetical protein|nr:hypothetical protein [Tianweitania sediminis]
MTDATAGIESLTGLDLDPNFGEDGCRDEKFCAGYFGNIQVSAIGFTFDVMPSSQDPQETYLSACAGALAGLGGMNVDLAIGAVAQAFSAASMSGPVELELSGVEMKVRPGYDDRLECSFVRP